MIMVLKKYGIEILLPRNIPCNTQIPSSKSIVAPTIIRIIVSLLSLENFLSKYPPNHPIIPSIIPLIPIILPLKISNKIPHVAPIVKPKPFPINSPMYNIKIINKFGFIPAM